LRRAATRDPSTEHQSKSTKHKYKETTMDKDLELVELLPAREEMSLISAFNFAAVGAVWQSNHNVQLGLIHFNAQANSVTVNG
jgi:hypothetical protein